LGTSFTHWLGWSAAIRLRDIARNPVGSGFNWSTGADFVGVLLLGGRAARL
jgi:hypothetical protein